MSGLITQIKNLISISHSINEWFFSFQNENFCMKINSREMVLINFKFLLRVAEVEKNDPLSGILSKIFGKFLL